MEATCENEWDATCPICYTNCLLEPKIQFTLCGHVFCRSCMKQVCSQRHSCCPLCRQPISRRFGKSPLLDSFEKAWQKADAFVIVPNPKNRLLFQWTCLFNDGSEETKLITVEDVNSLNYLCTVTKQIECHLKSFNKCQRVYQRIL